MNNSLEQQIVKQNQLFSYFDVDFHGILLMRLVEHYNNNNFINNNKNKVKSVTRNLKGLA